MPVSHTVDRRTAPDRLAGGDDAHAAMHAAFRWWVPEHFNIAQACCGRWAAGAGDRVAIRAHAAPGDAVLTFSALQSDANRLSGLLRELGVQRGDRVAIVMPQRFETAIAYMAVFQAGAVAMPLSMLFGPEALEYRLQDSGAVLAICDESSIDNLAAVRPQCTALRQVLGVGAAGARADLDWNGEMVRQSALFVPERTRAGDGAILIYTSGTTGPPKGALLPHRALIGNLPGFICSQNWFGFDPGGARASLDAPVPTPTLPPGGEGAEARGAKAHGQPEAGMELDTHGLPEPDTQSVFWSPADWAWTGGLMDALLPSLYFGRPIVAYNGRFSPELAFTLLQDQEVTHTFLFPTALKAMMKAYPEPARHFRLKLQGLMSAGEQVGDAVFDYCRTQLGVVLNEMFGQTEINYIVGNCSMNRMPAWAPQPPAASALAPGDARSGIGWPARPGSMGRPYPGHRVAVIDDDGNECPPGVPGDVALHRFDVHGDPDPILFLGYWNNPDATERKFTGDWCRTGDLATRDEDGYLWYEGRADDVFKAAGYRIGPGEIENCLVKHPAVSNAAVVPKPDAERGALVKAYVVLSPEFARERSGQDDATAFERELTVQLQAHVKGKLAPYEYPKEIEFIESLPMTTTGKVQRRVLRLQEEQRYAAAARSS